MVTSSSFSSKLVFPPQESSIVGDQLPADSTRTSANPSETGENYLFKNSQLFKASDDPKRKQQMKKHLFKKTCEGW